MYYIWEAMVILLTGVCLIRIAGKKTVAQMSGLEVITILAIASTTGHAISEQGLLKTILALCSLVALLMLVQYLAIKFNFVKRLMIGKATSVIQDGEIIFNNLKKLRISVDQLEARLRENGISSVKDVKTASIEITGQFGYELMNHAKTVTVGDLEKNIEQLQTAILQQISTMEQKETVQIQSTTPIRPDSLE
ncbi:YetF domain-containing protein [Bacillus sp. FJAT-49736]|uniref:DUF421 domain-containing protein n=1 Tax=Bacillus sp. FJAT-49736 TaxID=2833582 RepID=UPI001BC98C37|nr:YetF domain-containing protein [Bacillus sp. FJAT-49736]MBS4174311.1 DUF421 domain-containing protein [Bacillus sp. FJAT-49736]